MKRKQVTACLLILCFLLLSGCGSSGSSSFLALESAQANGGAAIGARRFSEQKCPREIQFFDDQSTVYLDWQGDRVSVTASDHSLNIRAEYEEDSRTLHCYLAQSSCGRMDCRFDPTGRLTFVAGFAYSEDDEPNMVMGFDYDPNGKLVYCAQDYDTSGGPAKYVLAFQKNDDGYAVVREDGTSGMDFSQWGDGCFYGDVQHMEYDSSGNLLRILDRNTGAEAVWLTYSDTARNPWRNLVLSLTYICVIAAANDGYIGHLPFWHQMGYQIPLSCDDRDLYRPGDVPQTQAYAYDALLDRALSVCTGTAESTTGSAIATPDTTAPGTTAPETAATGASAVPLDGWRQKVLAVIQAEEVPSYLSSIEFTLMDMNADGVPEIVVSFSEYEIGGVSGIWTWNGSDYVNAWSLRDILDGRAAGERIISIQPYRNNQTGAIEFWDIGDMEYSLEDYFETNEYGDPMLWPPIGELNENLIRYEIVQGKLRTAETHNELKQFLTHDMTEEQASAAWQAMRSFRDNFRSTHDAANVHHTEIRFAAYEDYNPVDEDGSGMVKIDRSRMRAVVEQY